MTLDHPIRSGLCHGPDCPEEITEKSGSADFCSDGCQARWSAALVGAQPSEPLPFWSHIRGGWSSGAESVEALRPSATPLLPWGLREGDLVVLGVSGEERLFSVTEPEPGRAVFNPIDDLPKPVRRSWWKPNTWRRS